MTANRSVAPQLWFDREAGEAAEFYVAAFPDSKVTDVTTIHDTPSGDCEILGYGFMARAARND